MPSREHEAAQLTCTAQGNLARAACATVKHMILLGANQLVI